MKGFFKEEEVRNKEADAPWKRSENDRMIELYLSGSTPTRIAIALERNPKAVKRRLEQYTYNERDFTVNYEPFRRTPRKGKRFTENELTLVKAWKKRGVPVKAQARFLQREMKEFALEGKDLSQLGDMRRIGVGVDLVMAYRYLYYCQNISILSDQAYDDLEKEEMEFGARGDLLKQAPSSDRPEDYPPHIRALALYLAFKYTKRADNKTDE